MPLPQFATVISGEIAGNVAATQLPNVSCLMVKFKAAAANAGKVYLGGTSGVTKADGATDATTGYALAAGEESPWLFPENLQAMWRICDNAGDNLTYIGFSS